MLLSIHELRNENGEIISEKKEVVEETLYNELKGKKEKLIQQIKTEKVIDPKCQKEADEAIENIKKLRCGHGEATYATVSCMCGRRKPVPKGKKKKKNSAGGYMYAKL